MSCNGGKTRKNEVSQQVRKTAVKKTYIVFLNRILFAVQLYISVKRGIYIATKKYVPQASSYLYGRYVKISIKSVDKPQITSKNPCTNRAWMCPELDCRTPFWKVYSELHYTSAHPGTSIPSEVKMSEAERKEVRKKKYLEGYHSYQIIKLSKEQEKSKSKRAQRKSHLSHL